MFNISIGIMAYNEDANIGRLLEAVLGQELKSGKIGQIVVVSSGSTDRTDEIVRGFENKDPRVRLIVQENREGKASAINEWLSQAGEEYDLCVMESADTLPRPDTVELMIEPFHDPAIGMTGGRPVPANDPDTFMGFLVHLLWGLHHRIALISPKLGEMVAFRNIVRSIPVETPVDEVSIEAVIVRQGLRLKYVPEAELTNRGAMNVGDFLKQRRRIYAGHLYTKSTVSYDTPTMKGGLVLKELLGLVKFSPRDITWTVGAVGLEVWGRLLGMYDYHVKKKLPYKWDIAASTKKVSHAEDTAGNSSL
ncbi:MAG: glycosyltransferase [Chloroflexi bacterium]|nr:glycosyltransferase [Chloroflexota bacterium]